MGESVVFEKRVSPGERSKTIGYFALVWAFPSTVCQLRHTQMGAIAYWIRR